MFLFAGGDLNEDDLGRKTDLDCGTVEYRDLVDPGGVIYTQVLVGCNSLGTYKYPPFLPNYT